MDENSNIEITTGGSQFPATTHIHNSSVTSATGLTLTQDPTTGLFRMVDASTSIGTTTFNVVSQPIINQIVSDNWEQDNEEQEEPDEEQEEDLKRITSEPEKLVFFHKRLMKMVDGVYPDEWDFRPKVVSDGSINENTYVMIIHFPRLTMKNSKGASHVIEDMYVKIHFLGFSFSASSIYGTRGKISTSEYKSDFAHSHLSGCLGFTPFCLGSTAYTSLITELAFTKWHQNPEEWEIRFEAFLFQLKSYLEWESIEGGPFRRIENIGTGQARAISLPERTINDGFNKFIRLVESLNLYDALKFVIDNRTGSVELMLDENVETLMLECAGEFFCYKDHLGNFYDTLDIAKTGQVPDFKGFVFKNNTVQAIFSDVIKSDDARKKYTNRKIVNHIKNELEQRFRKIWFEETFPVFARRGNGLIKRREAYNSSELLLEDYTVVQSSE